MRVGIGILGFGTVGGALLHKLVNEGSSVSTKTGLEIDVVRVAVRDLDKTRSVSLPADVLTDDPMEVVNHPDVQLVVEIMGGEDPAGGLVADRSRWLRLPGAGALLARLEAIASGETAHSR